MVRLLFSVVMCSCLAAIRTRCPPR